MPKGFQFCLGNDSLEASDGKQQALGENPGKVGGHSQHHGNSQKQKFLEVDHWRQYNAFRLYGEIGPAGAGSSFRNQDIFLTGRRIGKDGCLRRTVYSLKVIRKSILFRLCQIIRKHQGSLSIVDVDTGSLGIFLLIRNHRFKNAFAGFDGFDDTGLFLCPVVKSAVKG